MRKAAILLIDNDLTFLELTREFLEREGYRVIAVSTLDKARLILAQEPIALALVDYRLRDDDDDRDHSGLHLAQECTVPTIILTRFHEYEYVRNALRPGQTGPPAAVDFVVKQEHPRELLRSIQRVITKAKVFLSYARPDERQVVQLYDSLCSAGVTPWMDKRDLVGGEKWATAIRRAIRGTDFFILCMSSKSVTKRGFVQKEIRLALSILDEMLDEDVYLIPVRLEQCGLPHEKLRELQWIDLFEMDGFQKLMQAIRIGTIRRRQSPRWDGDDP